MQGDIIIIIIKECALLQTLSNPIASSDWGMTVLQRAGCLEWPRLIVSDGMPAESEPTTESVLEKSAWLVRSVYRLFTYVPSDLVSSFHGRREVLENQRPEVSFVSACTKQIPPLQQEIPHPVLQTAIVVAGDLEPSLGHHGPMPL